MAQQFFYDAQIRRFLIQFMRIVSNFEVEFGKGDDGTRTLQRVPVYYGDPSRQAAAILRQNSENIMNAVPAMSAYVSAFTYQQDRMQEPYFVSKMQMRERQYDPETGLYSSQQGDTYTIERLMPVPYNLEVKLDVWTSNTEQKMQLIEQLAVLFNPAFEIQSTDNYIDWTSLSYVQLSNMAWSSRTVPSGAEEPIDIATLTFTMPIWISAPAKVKRLGVIQKFIGSLYDETGAFSEETLLINLASRKYVTPLDYGILYSGNQMQLLKQQEIATAPNNVTINNVAPPTTWKSVIEIYGTLITGVTEIRLSLPNDAELIGTIAYHPTDPYIMLFEPIEDTMPSNTLSPINAIINPRNVAVDSNLLSPTAGTRYLLTASIGSSGNVEGSVVWNNLVADANDIIEFNGSIWQVVFDSSSETSTEYITNILTGVQYRWTGEEWIKSVEGVYRGGEWSLII